jgi:hypothetical protein
VGQGLGFVGVNLEVVLDGMGSNECGLDWMSYDDDNAG